MHIHELTNSQLRDRIAECCKGIHEDGILAIECKMGLGHYKDGYGRIAQVQVIVTTDKNEWFDEDELPQP